MSSSRPDVRNSAFICQCCGNYTSPFRYGSFKDCCSTECMEVEEAATAIKLENANDRIDRFFGARRPGVR